ncbi:hypothetical protein D3C84_1072660 [compost metagenome]
MGTHFAAIDGIFRTHALLDKGMAGFAQHRNTAGLLDLLNGVPSQTRIMNDLGARVLLEKHLRQ